MHVYDWLNAIFGKWPSHYTDGANRHLRHCRIGRVRMPDGWMMIVP